MSFDLKLLNKNLVLDNGKLSIVTSTNKLIQDILKIILTPIGSNPSFPWYGCALVESMPGLNLDPTTRNALIQSQIKNCIDNLVALQLAQKKSSQNVSAAEHIASISDISVIQDSRDPRGIIITIKVLTKAFNTVTTSFSVTL